MLIFVILPYYHFFLAQEDLLLLGFMNVVDLVLHHALSSIYRRYAVCFDLFLRIFAIFAPS